MNLNREKLATKGLYLTQGRELPFVEKFCYFGEAIDECW